MHGAWVGTRSLISRIRPWAEGGTKLLSTRVPTFPSLNGSYASGRLQAEPTTQMACVTCTETWSPANNIPAILVLWEHLCPPWSPRVIARWCIAPYVTCWMTLCAWTTYVYNYFLKHNIILAQYSVGLYKKNWVLRIQNQSRGENKFTILWNKTPGSKVHLKHINQKKFSTPSLVWENMGKRS